MNSQFIKNLKLILLMIDFVMLNFTLTTLAFFFHSHLLALPQLPLIFVGLNIAWLASSFLCTIYDVKHILSSSSILNCSPLSLLCCFLVFAAIATYFLSPLLSYPFIFIALFAVYSVMILIRLGSRFVLNFYRKQYFNANKVLIVGYNALSIQLAIQLEDDGVNKKIIGYCEETPNVTELSRYPILGDLQDIISVCNAHGATEIYSTITPDNNKHIETLSRLAERNCIRFNIVPNLGIYLNAHTEIQNLREITVISQHREPMQKINNRIIKRTFDIVFSLLVLILINSWLIPLIAIMIWMESGGNIMFTQKRSGENNVTFNIRKFRTMYNNKAADEKQAERNDTRITKVGKFLRRTSLDEFPQFFNVLMGEMSIVGPRPHMLKHTDEYSNLIEKYMVRQFIKPGITGWAQVNGYRGETKNIRQMQKRIEFDIWYVENWSLKTDLKVIFKTVYNVLKGEDNAY